MGGGAEFSNPIEVNSGVKFQGVTVSDIIIVTGTTGQLNEYIKLQALPEGFTPLNSCVLGWALTATNGNMVEHAPSVNVWLGNENVQVRVTDAGYVNCDLTVYIMRITE